LSDQYTEHHHHLVCLKCHHITEINENELEGFISNLANSYRFKPIEHQVEIQGYCESCVQSSESV
jgi:Fe2+ or Zn2+ uptake regulation protein